MTKQSTAGHTADWEIAAEKICQSVEDRVSATVKRATDSIYESVMTTTQDYLRDNVNFNLRSEIESLERSCASLRAEAANRETAVTELLAALCGVVAVADRETDEFIRARAAIAAAKGGAS